MNSPDAAQFANPATMPTPPGYSQLVEVTGGRLVFVAGQVALDSANEFVGLGDLEAQTAQVFRNLEAAIQSRNGSLTDIIKLTTFILDIDGLAVFRRVRDRFIPPGPIVPASTLIQVSRLFRPEFLIEIEATAWLRDHLT